MTHPDSQKFSRRSLFKRSAGLAGAVSMASIWSACGTATQPTNSPTLVGTSTSTTTFASISLLPEGKHPGQINFTPDQLFLVVPNQDTDNLSIIRTKDLTVTKTIQLQAHGTPWMAKVTPDGRFAYVTNSKFEGQLMEPSTVSVVDLQEGKVTVEIPVGAGPSGVTLDRSGKRAYVANQRSHTVSVIDATTHKVITTISVGRAPFFVELNLDETILGVTNFEDASLTLIDTANLKVNNTFRVGTPGLTNPFPEYGSGDTVHVAFTSENTAYVSNWRSNLVVLVDLTSGKILKSLSPVKNPFGLVLKQGLLSVASDVARHFVIIDTLASDKPLAVVPVDGSRLPTGQAALFNYWFTDAINNRINVILPEGTRTIGVRENIAQLLL